MVHEPLTGGISANKHVKTDYYIHTNIRLCTDSQFAKLFSPVWNFNSPTHV